MFTPEPFITISVFQLAAILAATFACVGLTWLLGLDEGRNRGRTELLQQQREYRSKGLWADRGHS